MIFLQDISTNTTLSESQICRSNSLFLCSLEHSLFDTLINEAIPYTYRIERDVYVPTIHEATEKLYTWHTFANFYTIVPIKQLLVNIVKNGGSGEIRTMERPFMSMIGEVEYPCSVMNLSVISHRAGWLNLRNIVHKLSDVIEFSMNACPSDFNSGLS